MTEPGATGRLVGIARRPGRRQPMEELEATEISTTEGVVGDWRGAKFPNRRVTVLAREAWQAALADLVDLAGPVNIPWTARRANLLVEGVDLPMAKGGVVRIGEVVLEVTAETSPCSRMEEAHRGLLKALHPDWRGGITCRVVESGNVRIGNAVDVLHAPPRRIIRLPG